MFKALFGRKPTKCDPHALYGAVVARARSVEFYRDLGVPDTLEGRFEMMSMHVYLILRRLKAECSDFSSISQDIFDAFIDDISIGFREAGVSDSVMPKRLQKMSRIFYGRAKAWDAAFMDKNPLTALNRVLGKNLYPEGVSSRDMATLAGYFCREDKRIHGMSINDVISNKAVFPASFPRLEEVGASK